MRCGKVGFFHRTIRRAAGGLAALLLLAPPLAAEEITVAARDGGLTLTGDYLGFDGTYLRLATPAGVVTLDYAGVECSGAACPDPEAPVAEWRLGGTTRMGEVLLPALIEGFAFSEGYLSRREETDPRTFDYVLSDRDTGADLLRFMFRLSDTPGGIADMIDLRTDAALSLRELTLEEREAAMRAGLGDLSGPGRARILALDALVPIVSAARMRQAIGIDELAAVLAGEVTDWADLGGAPGPISVHLPPREEGHVGALLDRVLAVSGGTLSPAVTFHPDAAGVAAVVSSDPNALGVVPYRAHGNAQPLAIEEACGYRAAADLPGLKTEDYPLTLPLFLYLPDRRLPPLAEEFVSWLRGERAQFIVRRAAFADLGAEPIPVAAQGDRLAAAIAAAGNEVGLEDLQRLVRLLGNRDRLSTTFRFEIGSTTLDAQSRSNVYQLARAIRDGTHDGQTLILAGFSDGEGAAAANRALSAARAETVLRALVDALGGRLPEEVRVRTLAFGEVLPMGCDETEWGRHLNRRVELWVGR